MATGSQIRALLESHIAGDDARFLATAMQIASREAKKGHSKVAEEIKQLVTKGKKARRGVKPPFVPPPPPRKLVGLVSSEQPKTRFASMVLGDDLRRRLQRPLREYRQRDKIRSHGLQPRRKLLLVGPPGTGKTMTAAAFAGELRLPLYTILIDGLVSKFMGETGAHLRFVFEAMASSRGVYLFDECDALFGERDFLNDVGESRRVLNSFLQLVDQDDSDSLVIAVTNHSQLLDRALYRRFDDLLIYDLPRDGQRLEVMKNTLAIFDTKSVSWDTIDNQSRGLSYADLVRACEDAAKEAILEDSMEIRTEALLTALRERMTPGKKKGLESGE